MNFMEGLNDQQRQAVLAPLGPVLVLAGPGSGKTRVLTHSIAYRIEQLGARPHTILAVTFTNKAAREMKERLTHLLGRAVHGLTLGTFHSVCARILRREADHLPFDPYFVIYDADDQLRLIKQILKDLNIDEKQFRPGVIHALISRAKNELIPPEEFTVTGNRDARIQQIYQAYQELLLKSNAMDFDDLLLRTATLLDQIPEVRDRYARRYEHILVDEFQDTNTAQYQLLLQLASLHRNMFVVGDADQSIYRWRGADYRNVRRFQQDFPETNVVLLEKNYRSTQVILDAAMAIIRPNRNRTHKELRAMRSGGEKIVLHEADSDLDEAQYVVDTIYRQASTGGASLGDFAVMYRTNAQSRVLEEAFLRAGLPYRLLGAQRFYGRREVKDVIAFLRLVYNPADEISLSRILNVPPRRIGQKTQAALREEAARSGSSPGEFLLRMSTLEDVSSMGSLSARAALALAEFGRMLLRWRSLYLDVPPVQLMDLILNDVGYEAYLDTTSEEGLGRWENVIELRRLAADYEDEGLGGFLEHVALISDQDTLDDQEAAPTLLTLHAAKGLEFDTVFIVGLEDGTLPHSRSFDEPEEMEEERRLLYVGVTRARNRLYLLHAARRATYGIPEETLPSRFLDDLPSELVSGQPQIRRRKLLRRDQAAQTRWEAPAVPSPARAKKTRYPAGTRVRHAAWGAGIVLNSRLEDGDETVDIFFERVGRKRVAASLARLDILED